MKTARTFSVWSLILLGVFFLSSCSKKDPAPSRTQLLTQTTWRLNAATSSDPITQSTLAAIIGTDWVFKTDKTFTITITTSQGSGSTGGTWSFSTDEKNLILTITGSSSTNEIMSLDASGLVIKEVEAGVTVTLSFVKKP